MFVDRAQKYWILMAAFAIAMLFLNPSNALAHVNHTTKPVATVSEPLPSHVFLERIGLPETSVKQGTSEASKLKNRADQSDCLLDGFCCSANCLTTTLPVVLVLPPQQLVLLSTQTSASILPVGSSRAELIRPPKYL